LLGLDELFVLGDILLRLDLVLARRLELAFVGALFAAREVRQSSGPAATDLLVSETPDGLVLLLDEVALLGDALFDVIELPEGVPNHGLVLCNE
jgi:hypothetical protein